MLRTSIAWMVMGTMLVAASTAAAQDARSAPGTSPPSDLTQARRALFGEAIVAWEAKDWATCRGKALGVWAQTRHAQVGALLGLCEEQLGMKLEAAEHLDFARKNDDKSNAGRTADIEAAWKRVSATIAVLELAASVDGVALRVRGKDAGALPQTLYLDPGEVEIAVSKEGYRNRTMTVTTSAGQSQVVQLVMEKADGQGATSRPIWPAALLGAAGGAGIVVGVAGFVVSAMKASDAAAIGEEVVANGGCAANAARCEEAQAAFDAEPQFRGMGIAGLVVGAAAFTGMAIYLTLPEAKPASGRVTLQPFVGADTGGLFVRGSF